MDYYKKEKKFNKKNESVKSPQKEFQRKEKRYMAHNTREGRLSPSARRERQVGRTMGFQLTFPRLETTKEPGTSACSEVVEQ